MDNDGLLVIATSAALLGFYTWFLSKQVAAAEGPRRRLTSGEVRAIVDRLNASDFGGFFTPAHVVAVAAIESSFDPDAVRYEAHLDDSSIGLMQVLSSTAADRGYTGPPSGLFDTELNILIGMRHLKWSWDYLARRMGRNPTLDEWIGSYNAGVGNVAGKGWWSAGYVQKWREAVERYS